MSSVWDDFGQKLDLTVRIKEILRNYPSGITILNELLQNADDAGATTVRFVHDRRTHGTESLAFEGLAQFQGPSFLCYNDAMFTAADFESLQRVGNSGKHDPMKTGRFGLGFNAVYHFTDVPAFVSGDYLVYFDPHACHLPNVNPANPGKRVNFTKTSLRDYRDQVHPFCVFGCDMKKSYRGTLFRFPLRTHAQAAQSRISSHCYLDEDVNDLFHTFTNEAQMLLLFLKSVRRIEWCEIGAHSSKPETVFSVSVSGDFVYRTGFESVCSGLNTSDVFVDTLKVRLDFVRDGRCTDERWLVHHQSGGKQCRALASDPEYAHLRLLPWGGVAARLDNGPHPNGTACCFLPLHIDTELPVHINGFFELSSNRRDIWWGGGSMAGDGKFRYEWNLALLREAIAPAYASLIHSLNDIVDNSDMALEYWPVQCASPAWEVLTTRVYELLAQKPVLWCPRQPAGEWIRPSQAVVTCDNLSNDLIRVILRCGINIVPLPSQQTKLLQQNAAAAPPSTWSVGFLLKWLRSVGEFPSDLCTFDDGLILLEYVLSKLPSSQLDELYGVPLVPLHNREFGIFHEEKHNVRYFTCSTNDEETLLMSVPHVFVWNEHVELYQHLSSRLLQSKTNIKSSGGEKELSHIVSIMMPSAWLNRVVVPFDEWNGVISGDVLQTLWRMLSNVKDLRSFMQWPLVMTADKSLIRLNRGDVWIMGPCKIPSMVSLWPKLDCYGWHNDVMWTHDDRWRILYHANGRGVLQMMTDRGDEVIESVVKTLNREERGILRHFICHSLVHDNVHLSGQDKNLLRRLRIYDAYQCAEGVDLEGRFLVPKDIVVESSLYDSRFIVTSSENVDEEMILTKLGVKSMPSAVFYRECVFPRVAECDRKLWNSTMVSMLRVFGRLCRSDRNFAKELRDFAFIPVAASDQLHRPCDLFDPDVEDLVALLDADTYFPIVDFTAESEVLGALRQLGLRASMNSEVVLRCVEQIVSSGQHDSQRSVAKSKRLLSYVDRRYEEIFDETCDDEWRTRFTSLPWLPVLTEPPLPSMPWREVHRSYTNPRLASARMVRPQKDMWLVSSMLRILDHDLTAQSPLVKIFGWNQALPLEVLCFQLQNMSRTSCANEMLRQWHSVCLSLYERIHAHTEFGGDDVTSTVKSILDERIASVWIDGSFVKPSHVSIEGDNDVEPFLRRLPKEYEAFKDLFVLLGARQEFEVSDYGDALARMRLDVDSDHVTKKAIICCDRIAALTSDSGEDLNDLGLYLPAEDGKLYPASQLLFNDAPWLSASTGNRKWRFVHPDLTTKFAQRSGASSLRSMVLRSQQASSKGALETPSFETIAVHLRDLIEMRRGNHVTGCAQALFDLLELCDVLGSQRFELVHCTKQYATESLVTPMLAETQGDAICIYWPRVLLPDEVVRFHRLCGYQGRAEVTKAKQKLRVPYGHGLVSAYALGDVLEIVSGDLFMLMDPSGQYSSFSGKKRETGIGRVFDIAAMRQFPDQMRPFLDLPFGFDGGPFSGTILRIPFSSIDAQTNATKSSGIEIMTAFQKHVPSCLLFASSVEAVSIVRLSGGTNSEAQCRDLYLTSCASSKHTREKRAALANNDSWMSEGSFFTSFLHRFKPVECSYFVDINTADYMTQEVNRDVFVVCGVLGADDSRKVALERRKFRERKPGDAVDAVDTSVETCCDVTPIGAVAAHITRNGQSVETVDGMVFCGCVPLLTCTQSMLPVHISASFEVQRAGPSIGSIRSPFFCRNVVGNNNDMMDDVDGGDSRKHDKVDSDGVVVASTKHVEDDSDDEKDDEADDDIQVECVVVDDGVDMTLAPTLPLVDVDDGLSAVERDALEWNQELMQSCVAMAYANVLHELRNHYRISGNGLLLYKFWPLRRESSPGWYDLLMPTMYGEVCSHRMFLNSKNEFSRVNEVLFQLENVPTVVWAFASRYMPVATVPSAITSELRANVEKDVRCFTTQAFRHELKSNRRMWTDIRQRMKSTEVVELLKFSIGDAVDSEYECINGLPLVPLRGDKVGVFGTNRFVVGTQEQYDLLPIPSLFADESCVEVLQGHCESLTFKSRFLFEFNARFVHVALDRLLENHLTTRRICVWPLDTHDLAYIDSVIVRREEEVAVGDGGDPVAPPPLSTLNGYPNPRWLKSLWNKIDLDDDTRQYLHKWPLLPLLPPNPQSAREVALVELFDNILVPPSACDDQTMMVLSALTEFKLPILDVRFFPVRTTNNLMGMGEERYRSRLPLLVVEKLDMIFGGRVDQVEWSREQASAVCAFFNDGFRQGLFQHNHQRVLSLLPMFELYSLDDNTPESTFISLDGHRRPFMFPPNTELPPSLVAFAMKSGQALKFQFSDFYRFLNVHTLELQAILEEHLENCFVVLDGAESDVLMKYVVDNWAQVSTQKLRDVIGRLEFARCATGQEVCNDENEDHEAAKRSTHIDGDEFGGGWLREPTALLDPQNKIFIQLFQQERRFPSSRYRSPEWISFLKDVGMTHQITHDVFLMCARQAERLGGHGVTKEVLVAAHDLVEYLWTHVTDFTASRDHNEFWPTLSELKFVPCRDVVTGEVYLNSYSSVGSESDINVVFTTLPIAKEVPQVFRSRLRIQSPPSMQVVMEHVQKVSSIPLDSWSDFNKNATLNVDDRVGMNWRVDVPRAVFTDILKYWCSRLNECEMRHIEELRRIPLVPVGNRLVKASRLYFRLDQDLSPFMFELPRYFGAYEPLLLRLGTKERPQFSDYVSFLGELGNEVGSDALNINELRAVCNVLELMNGLQSDDAVVGKSELPPDTLVPNDSNQLVPLSTVMFNDSPWIAKRVERERVQLVTSMLSQKLCMRVGVNRLSKCVSEVLLGQPQVVDTVDDDETKVVRLLASQSFCRSVVRLFQDQVTRDQSYADYTLIPSVNTVMTLLNSYRVYFVSELRTKLIYRNTDVTSDGAHNTLMFVADQVVYISVKSTAVRPALLIAQFVQKVLADATRLRLRDMAPIVALLECQSEAQLDQLLDRLEIYRIDDTALTRGRPGEDLVETDREFLQIKPLREFMGGEIVAVKRPGEEQLIYGHVVKESRDVHGAIARVHVMIGNETRQYLSTEVQSFKSFAGAVSSGSRQKKNVDRSRFRRKTSNHAHSLRVMEPDVPFDVAQGQQTDVAHREQENTLDESADPNQQLIDAVSEILAKVNLPVSLSRQDLMKQNIHLQEQVERVKAEAHTHRERTRDLQTKVEEMRNCFTCGICTERQKDSILVPCGHMLCKECLNRVSRCPFCRQRYSTTAPFFAPF